MDKQSGESKEEVTDEGLEEIGESEIEKLVPK